MKKDTVSRALLAALMCAGVFKASATTVFYDVANISGNTWEYTYTVSNDTLSVDIEEFTIFFGAGLYENLAASATPADWDPLIVEPDPLIPPAGDDGFYDALALSVGIRPGDSLGGFSVQFDYLGAGTPGEQFFDIVDPNTFTPLDSGFTQAVPLPAAIWLFTSGLLGVVSLSNARYRKSA